MRTIEFKTWDTVQNKMMDWDNLKYEFSLESMTLAEMFERPRYIPLQFTGLIDQPGKKIFESDIVKISPGFGCIFNEAVGVVEYEYASFWLVFKNQSIVLADHNCTLEVIGNIFENPELIP